MVRNSGWYTESRMVVGAVSYACMYRSGPTGCSVTPREPVQKRHLFIVSEIGLHHCPPFLRCLLTHKLRQNGVGVHQGRPNAPGGVQPFALPGHVWGALCLRAPGGLTLGFVDAHTTTRVFASPDHTKTRPNLSLFCPSLMTVVVVPFVLDGCCS